MPVTEKTYRLLRRRRVQIALLFALGMLVMAFAPLPASASRPQERFFQIQAGNFAYAPAVLRVNQGDRVTIELASQDVTHGLFIDGYDLEVRADPGQPQRLSFTADRAGSFRLRCSVICGALHPFMAGQLKVGANALLWRALGGAVLATLAGFWMAFA
jgi:heme/copper-type cytochrome/quinol oxidase subunit 2